MDLNLDKFFSLGGDFVLSFQIRIRTEHHMTFGYVFRLIDIDNNNVDLIVNGPKANSLQVIYGNQLTDISLPCKDSAIFRKWNEIRIHFNLKNQSLEFISPDTALTETGIKLANKVKIFFGRNSYDHIQTTDVPTMDIKDIRIYKRNRCIHHFPLDEISGDMAHDVKSNVTGLALNPEWIRPKYYNWSEHFPTYLSGFAAVCFDPAKERLFMVGDEQLKIFHVVEDSIQDINYSSKFNGLIPASQVVYDAGNNRLICYSLLNRTMYLFNASERRWEEVYNGPDNSGLERYRFHNKHYFSEDSVLYVFGGYSQHKYFNLVLRYDFRVSRWDTIDTSGDVFYPRMHAAMGVLGDTVYLLGGYGSTEGDQILNPRHYSDFLAYSLKDQKFVKKHDFVAPQGDFDFAHYMVIDSTGQNFYVLASSIYKYEASLQLLKGSLSNPQLITMGDQIPYLFHNENSYADLFFSRSLQELIAITLLTDPVKDETEIKVFTIAFPPSPTVTGNMNIKGLLREPLGILIALLILISLGMLVAWWYFRRNKKSLKKNFVQGKERSVQYVIPKPSSNGMKNKKPANSILFFGGFQVINKDAEDITRKFSPLLKELFLLIFLYSIKDKGISVQKLTELLWFSMDMKSAKNNRAVNIAKLKHLLSEIETCDLTRKTEYWQILFDDSRVYSDYLICHQLTTGPDTLAKDDLERLLTITKAGSLLGNANYEWLDEFKLECSNQITDVLMQYIEQQGDAVEPDLLVRIADAILIFDIMHEEAISIKCKALTALGKHSLAKEIFNKFAKDYRTLYDEPYERTFTDIIRH